MAVKRYKTAPLPDLAAVPAASSALRIASYPLILLWLALAVAAAVPVVAAVPGAWKEYLWFAAGMAACFAAGYVPFLVRNEAWAQVFTHELCHTVVSLAFLQRIHSFSADSSKGRVSYSGSGAGDIFVSLAPYCLPLFTYMFMLLRLLSDPQYLYIFDILIGITFAFHIRCWRAQTGMHQSDITDQGTFRAFAFIIAAWIFNASVVLITIRSSVVDAFAEIFASYWESIKSATLYLVSLF